jgi:threonine dehydrogenase-like Zn-dependent dehydrogenase
MPRELVTLEPRKPGLREYDEPALGPQQVRIRTQFASPKHGTEMVGFRGRGRGRGRGRFDPELGCFVYQPSQPDQPERPHVPGRLGNMAVGEITEIGAEVSRFKVGDRVFGHMPIRETQTVDAGRIALLPEGLAPEWAVCLDPAVMAFAMRDAEIKIGDRVAVFGLGAIGLMALQLARLSGADQVIGVDFIEARRELAMRYGADHAISPVPDGGLRVRELTKERADPNATAAAVAPPQAVVGGYRDAWSQWGNLGVDVAVEVSGSPKALQDAIRATAFGGTICLLSFYDQDAAGVYLGDEFHVNRQKIISCRAETLPLRDAPMWNLSRMAQTCLRWLTSGRLRADGMVWPIVTLDQAAEAYLDIDEHPERSVKLGVRF